MAFRGRPGPRCGYSVASRQGCERPCLPDLLGNAATGEGAGREFQGLAAFEIALRFRKILEGRLSDSGELLRLLEWDQSQPVGCAFDRNG